jgi:hypothetical protein
MHGIHEINPDRDEKQNENKSDLFGQFMSFLSCSIPDIPCICGKKA